MPVDCEKIGKMICQLRKEKAMTQKHVADLLNISDKAISKWERGFGCPDVSLLPELSKIFGVNIEEILSGEIVLNETVGGNMKKLSFYVPAVREFANRYRRRQYFLLRQKAGSLGSCQGRPGPSADGGAR
jgi:Predicted transcriptional regulators